MIFAASAVFADNDKLARFKGGIGVTPVSSGVGTAATAEVVNRNIVRGVQPAGQIWVIDKLEANVKTNGDIKVEGKGLILGGGNNVGRATGQSVFATLICEVAPAVFIEHSTTLTGVPLPTMAIFKSTMSSCRYRQPHARTRCCLSAPRAAGTGSPPASSISHIRQSRLRCRLPPVAREPATVSSAQLPASVQSQSVKLRGVALQDHIFVLVR